MLFSIRLWRYKTQLKCHKSYWSTVFWHRERNRNRKRKSTEWRSQMWGDINITAYKTNIVRCLFCIWNLRSLITGSHSIFFFIIAVSAENGDCPCNEQLFNSCFLAYAQQVVQCITSCMLFKLCSEYTVTRFSGFSSGSHQCSIWVLWLTSLLPQPPDEIIIPILQTENWGTQTPEVLTHSPIRSEIHRSWFCAVLRITQ